ncbi:MAG: hypothetical protein KDD85_09855 [Parvularculaceae bacterium]|nr:hypothetical protein [Parvularculaceae bacterium]
MTASFTYLFNEAVDRISDEQIEEKRAEAIAEARAYLEGADLSRGSDEDGIVALLDLTTGEIRYLYGSEAGRGTPNHFYYRFSRGPNEIVLVIGHSHPASNAHNAIERMNEDRSSEGIRNNSDDDGLVGLRSEVDPTRRGATLVIITPTGKLREYPGGG